MDEVAAPVNSLEPVQHTCVSCRWARADDGSLYEGQDRAYCGQPDVRSDTGAPVACESQRFSTASELLKVCGTVGIYWEAR